MTNGKEPAFTVGIKDLEGEYLGGDGLTKREYFAAMAMQGILSQNTVQQNGYIEEKNLRNYAFSSVALADVLIYALNEMKQ